MNKTTIYLVRHAKVENPKNICYGRLPGFGLSDEGIKQAQKLAKFFKSKKINRIYTSPLLRARKTAEIISNGLIPLSVTKNLTEIGCHSVQGHPMSVALNLRNKAHRSKNIFPDERYIDVQHRIVAEIERIAKKNLGGNTIIVSHADPILCAKMYYLGKPLEGIEQIPVVNGSATILTFSDKLECIKVDYKNLTGAKRDF